MSIEILEKALSAKFPELRLILVDPRIFYFEERVKHKCFHCKNYKVKWTCPPNIPDVDYQCLFGEYDQGAIVIYTTSVTKETLDERRYLSTNYVHKGLLFLEQVLYEHNNSMALSFIGGSCKLCKNGCSDKRCVNPGLSRVPLEATGVNVIKSLKQYGIDIIFPITDKLCRYGMILW